MSSGASVTLPSSQGATGTDGGSWFKVVQPVTRAGTNEKTDVGLDCDALVTHHPKFKSWHFELKTECWGRPVVQRLSEESGPKRSLGKHLYIF